MQKKRTSETCESSSMSDFSLSPASHYNLAFFTPPGYPGGQHGTRSLSDTLTHNQKWELNTRPFNFESKALSM